MTLTGIITDQTPVTVHVTRSTQRGHLDPNCRFYKQSSPSQRSTQQMLLGEYRSRRHAQWGLKACKHCGLNESSRRQWVTRTELKELFAAVARARKAQGDLEGAKRARMAVNTL